MHGETVKNTLYLSMYVLYVQFTLHYQSVNISRYNDKARGCTTE